MANDLAKLVVSFLARSRTGRPGNNRSYRQPKDRIATDRTPVDVLDAGAADLELGVLQQPRHALAIAPVELALHDQGQALFEGQRLGCGLGGGVVERGDHAQDTAKDAHAQWRVVADQLRGKFDKIGSHMDGAEHEVLAYMDFPKAHWLQIHSTNPLERLNAEIKRRTNVVGIFPNDAAITRLVGAMLLEQNDEWSLNRRYMQLEGLQSLSDTAPARLSAIQR